MENAGRALASAVIRMRSTHGLKNVIAPAPNESAIPGASRPTATLAIAWLRA